MIRRATQVTVRRPLVLLVGRDDGTEVEVDLTPYLALGVFGSLREADQFAAASIDRLGGVEWPCGASLSPELLAAEQDEINERAAHLAANAR